MNERHVPSLEISQEFDRLCNEKGIIVPATEFYWNVQSKKVTAKKYRHSYHSYLDESSSEQEGRSQYKNIPAPIVSELGEWLPQGFLSSKTLSNYACAVPEHWSEQMISTYGLNNRDLWDISKSKTEADARQKMLNYLIAEGIVTTL